MSARKQPRKAKRLWLETGHSVAKLARLLGYRGPHHVRDVLNARYASVSDATRTRIENIFTRYDIPIEGMWDLDDQVAPSQPQSAQRCHAIANTNPDDDAQEKPVRIPTREQLSLQTLKHFGLEADPFDDIPIVQSWDDQIRQYLRASIQRAVQAKDILAVYGGVGSGKSTMLRQLLLSLGDRQVAVCAPAAVNRKRLTDSHLVSALLRDLGTDDPGYSMAAEKRSQVLREQLEKLNANGVLPVLVIDEAHDLSDQALVALKRIWDSYTIYRLLSIVLVGQESIEKRLRHNLALQEFAGRCHMFRLPELEPADAYNYVAHRFKVTGGDAAKVFAEDAFKGFSSGVPMYPLWINAIAVRAMRLAQDMGDELVTTDHINRA